MQTSVMLDSLEAIVTDINMARTTLDSYKVEDTILLNQVKAFRSHENHQEKLRQRKLYMQQKFDNILRHINLVKRLVEPFLLQLLPPVVLDQILQLLSVEDKNNLRLTSTWFAETVLCMDKHYESGLVEFDQFNMESVLHSVDLWTTKLGMDSQNMDLHLNIISVDNPDSFSNFPFDYEGILGEISVSGRTFEVALDAYSLNKLSISSQKKVFKILNKRKITSLQVSDAEFVRHLLPELYSLSLTCLDIDNSEPNLCRELVCLIRGSNTSLQKLKISGPVGRLDLGCQFTKLRHLVLDNMQETCDVMKLVKTCTTTLQHLTVSNVRCDMSELRDSLPNLRELEVDSPDLLYIAGLAAKALRVLVLPVSKTISDVASVLARSRLHFPHLFHLVINLSTNTDEVAFVKRHAATLNCLAVSFDTDDNLFLPRQEVDIELPQLTDLMLKGSGKQLFSFVRGCATTLETLRLYGPDWGLNELDCDLPQLRRLILHSPDDHVVAAFKNKFPALKHVETGFVTRREEDEILGRH